MTVPINMTVLHVSPHPDDELLGAGATLSLLQQSGWTVVNLACSLGRPVDYERRRAELKEAADRSGYRTIIADPPAALSRTDNMGEARKRITVELTRVLQTFAPAIVVSPQPYDGHHGHEIVGQTVQDVLRKEALGGLLWWQWGWWRELPRPTLYVPFEEDILKRVEYALAAYEGENARNDYLAAYRAKATLQPVLGSERIFGYGTGRASASPYAELLTENLWDGTTWLPGSPRILHPEHPNMTHSSVESVSLEPMATVRRSRQGTVPRISRLSLDLPH